MKSRIFQRPFATLHVLVAVGMLAACGDGNRAEIPSEPPSEKVTAAMAAPDAIGAEEGVELPLPGLKLEYPYVIKSDSTYEQKLTGQLRRALVLEFNEATIGKIFEDTSDELTALGFTTRNEPTASDDLISQSFFGRGGAYLEVRKNLETPSASGGTVVLSWPIRSKDDPITVLEADETVQE